MKFMFYHFKKHPRYNFTTAEPTSNSLIFIVMCNFLQFFYTLDIYENQSCDKIYFQDLLYHNFAMIMQILESWSFFVFTGLFLSCPFFFAGLLFCLFSKASLLSFPIFAGLLFCHLFYISLLFDFFFLINFCSVFSLLACQAL